MHVCSMVTTNTVRTHGTSFITLKSTSPAYWTFPNPENVNTSTYTADQVLMPKSSMKTLNKTHHLSLLHGQLFASISVLSGLMPPLIYCTKYWKQYQ
jgi:hypothetical protein